MALKIRRVFLYVSISIISFITIHHFILPSSSNSPSFNHHLFIPLIQNDAVSEKLYQDHKIIQGTLLSNASSITNKLVAHHDVTSPQYDEHDDVNSPLVHVNSSILTDDVNSPLITTVFDNDDVTSSSVSTKFDDVKSPLVHVNSSIVTDDVNSPLISTVFDNDDVTSSVRPQHDDVNSPLVQSIVTDFHNHDVNSSLISTDQFDNDDVTSSSVSTKFDDVKSPLVHVNSSIVTDDVNSPLISTVFDNDDVTSSVRPQHDDVNSPLVQSIVTDFHNHDVNSPLISTDQFDNDDVTSSVSTKFDDVNSPLSHVNSSNITGFDNDDDDDVTSSHIHEVNSGTDDVTSPTSNTQFDSDEINSALITQFDGHNVNLPLITQLDDVTVTSPVSSRQFHDNDDVTVIANVSVLFPAWEALVIVKSDIENNKNSSFYCLFDTNEVTKAKFYGTLSFSRETYTCRLPTRFRRRLPFRQPVLTHSKNDVWVTSASAELLRWNYIVYDVFDNDENDVILLVKGINNRQGVNRSPKEFRCLFGDDLVKGVLTDVSSSLQEVFRCKRPDLSRFTGSSQSVVKASLVIVESNHVVPSIAYYEPRRRIVKGGGKKLLCACTMVYNVAKFLKEWVIYHADIGVEKFVLYDNGSDDDLGKVVEVLKSRGYDVEVRFWLWPKTQEAGFSHAAFVDKGSCKWMMYIDVDEFVYSPKWKSLKPSKGLLPSLLPSSTYGQVMIKCYEFGPSGQKKHPLMGVTQGYNCRKEVENRHKSIVLLDAVHESLLNMIHHFKLKDGYSSMKAELENVVVNHYKYQAWVEFKAKFRRRVSAYVVDWTRSVNLKSNDRAPGLGNLAVKPDGWEDRFCEVRDNRLRDLTRRWFGRRNGRSGVRMAWQK